MFPSDKNSSINVHFGPSWPIICSGLGEKIQGTKVGRHNVHNQFGFFLISGRVHQQTGTINRDKRLKYQTMAESWNWGDSSGGDFGFLALGKMKGKIYNLIFHVTAIPIAL